MKKQDKVPKKVLNALKKEYFALIRGQKITVSATIELPIKVPVHITWQSDVLGERVWDEPSYSQHSNYYYDQLDEVINKNTDKALKQLNKKVHLFCQKTSMLAKQYGVDENEVIWNFLWDEQNKAGL